MNYVVFTCGAHYDVLWAGKTTSLGTPVAATHVTEVRVFETARDAYAEAGRHRGLQQWRVGRLFYRRLPRRHGK